MSLSFIKAYAQGASPKDTIVIASRFNDNITLDPAENSDLSGIEFIMNTYDRLTACDTDDFCTIKGAAAKSWSVAENGKTFTFNIRKGISFASGNPLTAHDAVFSLHRLILLNSPGSSILSQLGFNPENIKQKIRVKDKYTLTIETDKKYPPNLLPRCLAGSSASIVDKKEVMKQDDNNDMGNKWLKINYAGSGPYRLRQLKQGKSILLDKNNMYWAGAPKMDKINIRNIADPSTRLMLVKMGEIDIARDVGSSLVKGLENEPGLTFKTGAKGCLYYIGINHEEDILSNPGVRQALKYLVDYKGIADDIFNNNVLIHQSLIPRAYTKTSLENPFNYDIEKARSILEQAGYKQGFNISINIYNDYPFTDIAEVLKSSFAKADIKLEINYMDHARFSDNCQSKNYDLYMDCWGADFQSPETSEFAFAWESNETSPFILMFQKTETAVIKSIVKGFDFGPGSGSSYQYIIKE